MQSYIRGHGMKSPAANAKSSSVGGRRSSIAKIVTNWWLTMTLAEEVIWTWLWMGRVARIAPFELKISQKLLPVASTRSWCNNSWAMWGHKCQSLSAITKNIVGVGMYKLCNVHVYMCTHVKIIYRYIWNHFYSSIHRLEYGTFYYRNPCLSISISLTKHTHCQKYEPHLSYHRIFCFLNHKRFCNNLGSPTYCNKSLNQKANIYQP